MEKKSIRLCQQNKYLEEKIKNQKSSSTQYNKS
jgi:hypothetical protein